MSRKNSSKRALLISAFSGLVLLAAFFLYSAGNIVAPSIQESIQEQVEIGLPARLKIPSINVDAPVEYVGLTSEGAMDVPQDPANVAWFNLRSRPGQIGTAVIAGHYDWTNNTPAVFDDLHKLRIGDKISVEDEKGIDVTFIVREIRTYGKDAVVPEVFGSSDGKAHLNLITCKGSWNKAEQSYSERLVVFTDEA